MEDKLLTTKEAANFLKLSEWTLFEWRKKGVGPKWIRYGVKMVKYPMSDLINFKNEGNKGISK